MDYGCLPERILCSLLQPKVERRALTNVSCQVSRVRKEHTTDHSGKPKTLRHRKIPDPRSHGISRDPEAPSYCQREETETPQKTGQEACQSTRF